MKWFTGTPCNFEGTQTFFDRDSGLTMRGFAALGIETGSITLGPARADDFSEMTRATWAQLENPAWWATLHLDGLIFYTWGDPRYVTMVRAAKKAGIQVAQVTDAQGIMSPLADWGAHLRAENAYFWQEPRWKRMLRWACKILYSHTIRLFTRDLAIVRAIASSDLFFCVTPNAETRFRNLAGRLGDKKASEHIHFVPLPVNFHFCYDGSVPKSNEVVAVGRWDSYQKRTPLLMESVSRLLDLRQDVRFRIFGNTTPELRSWHANLPWAKRHCVILEGLVPNNELVVPFQSAKVMLVSSAYESFHIASAEAICCGASVVACRSPFLDPIEWQASRNSGRLAERATGESLAQALVDELAAWDRGERDPIAISTSWTRELHPDRVAARILELCHVPISQPAR